MTTPDRDVAPRRKHRPVLIRDAHAGHLSEVFLVAAVTTILVVRGFLALTRYPALGGGRLHIAHMLWGGLALAAALILVLLSLDRRVRPPAAVLGGIGFGLFIDELGKFITRDNNYFYQPTIAIIYAVFVTVYLTMRRTLARGYFTTDENVANAMSLMSDLAVWDFDEDEKAKARSFLERSQPDPRAALLSEFLDRLEASPASRPGGYTRLKQWFRVRIGAVVRRPWFVFALGVMFVTQAVLGIIWALVTAKSLWPVTSSAAAETHIDRSVVSIARVFTTLLSGVFVVIGVMQIRSRVRSYRWFRRALRVTVFGTQFLVFYDDELTGLLGLAVNIILLAVIEYLIREEQARPPSG